MGNLPIAPARSVAPITATDFADQSAEIALLKGWPHLLFLIALAHPKGELRQLKSWLENSFKLAVAKSFLFRENSLGNLLDQLKKYLVLLDYLEPRPPLLARLGG